MFRRTSDWKYHVHDVWTHQRLKVPCSWRSDVSATASTMFMMFGRTSDWKYHVHDVWAHQRLKVPCSWCLDAPTTESTMFMMFGRTNDWKYHVHDVWTCQQLNFFPPTNFAIDVQTFWFKKSDSTFCVTVFILFVWATECRQSEVTMNSASATCCWRVVYVIVIFNCGGLSRIFGALGTWGWLVPIVASSATHYRTLEIDQKPTDITENLSNNFFIRI